MPWLKWAGEPGDSAGVQEHWVPAPPGSLALWSVRFLIHGPFRAGRRFAWYRPIHPPRGVVGDDIRVADVIGNRIRTFTKSPPDFKQTPRDPLRRKLALELRISIEEQVYPVIGIAVGGGGELRRAAI